MDLEQNIQLLTEFPLLLPQNKEFTVFDGFIQAAGEEFHLYIQLKNPPSVKGIVIFCPINLRYFLDACKSNLIEWENSAVSLIEFLRRLQNLIAVGIQHGKLSKSISSSSTNSLQKSIEFYSWIIDELLNLESQEGIFLENPSEGEFNEIQLRFENEDSFGRMHTALLKYEPVTLAASVTADLPTQVELVPQKGMAVYQIYKKFANIVESLQDFWNLMDCIDQKCWVIDPEHPKRKDTYRRIVLGTNISMYINIDPLDLYKRPDITFIGSERTIIPFKNSLEENLEYLDGLGTDIVEVLANTLGLDKFPQKSPIEGESEDIEQGECSICLCIRMEDGQLPSEVCSNPLCALPFHSNCLYMWLQSFQTSHQNFNKLYGKCPNCDSAISCPLPT